MRLLATLRSRIFLACVVVSVLSVGITSRFVTDRVTAQADAELRRGLRDAADHVERQHRSRVEQLRLMARLVADLPKLKAAVATGDPPTVEPLARDYTTRLGSDVLEIVDPAGRRLAVVPPLPEGAPGPVEELERTQLRSIGDDSLLVVSVPIVVGPEPRELLGALSVGFALDAELAAEYEALTDSEIAFVVRGRVQASTLGGSAETAALGEARELADPEPRVWIGAEEYAVERRSLPVGDDAEGLEAVVLRSRTRRLGLLDPFRAALIVAALVAAGLAVGLSYLVARSVTGPLSAITARMREMAETGDLTRRIELRRSWDDEDARLLASTFNTLTESLDRFQREAAVRGRLQALGRLSAVIAHEVRNPLMIIKAAQRTLRRAPAPSEDAREALEEIEQEVARLDRIVADVLDFARPIRPVCEPTNLAELCTDAATAVASDGSPPTVRVEVEAGLGEVVTDPERLRTVLVNVLQNARDATRERANAGGGTLQPVTLRVGARNGTASLEVRDEGVGIASDALPHVFDPFFTTKRTGTGLGLALSRNVVESLGGSLSIDSERGVGTRVRLEIPMSRQNGRA